MTPPPSLARPRIHINCAVSLDGRLAYAGGRRALLSGPKDLERVQRLRAEMAAILVGVGTVLADDPSLRVHWELLDQAPGRSPYRVILDTHGRTPPTAKVLDATQPTLVAMAADSPRVFPAHIDTFRSGQGEVPIPALLTELTRREIRSVLVEGGAKVLASFLRAGVVDTMTVFVAPVVIGGTTAPPMVAGADTSGPVPLARMRRVSTLPLDDGSLLSYEAMPS